MKQEMQKYLLGEMVYKNKSLSEILEENYISPAIYYRLVYDEEFTKTIVSLKIKK